MPIHAVETKRLYRQIADQLRALIEQNEFPVGSRLPAERDLAQRFQVSRPSVREALIALEVEGLVEVRMGSGIYVVGNRRRALIEPVSAEGPLEIIKARQVIEAELAANAARSMTKKQLSGLRDAVSIMEREASEGKIPESGDRLFHVLIAETAGNSVLLRVVTELFDERHNPLFVQLGNHFENACNWSAAIAEHRAVMEAIASGSAQRARKAMWTHLQRSHDRFIANWSEKRTEAKPAGSSAASAERRRSALPRQPVASAK